MHCRSMRAEITTPTLRAPIAAAQQDATFQHSFHVNFILPRERIMTALLQKAQERGELSPHQSPVMVWTMIHGAFWYRFLKAWNSEC
ncbi:TetR-like C-terminal domain-containing protein [Pacificibacter sp. 1_MG-2023]|nr:TetR-like C-terminal domain-containing protein [Pacificibacter sp. 1_MG-2023]MDO6616002.1 TetR-like C-terminal domain-containing protein [Pacificibacter sp. 1_MG-2023]